jgi:hypothetical protein
VTPTEPTLKLVFNVDDWIPDPGPAVTSPVSSVIPLPPPPPPIADDAVKNNSPDAVLYVRI